MKSARIDVRTLLTCLFLLCFSTASVVIAQEPESEPPASVSLKRISQQKGLRLPVRIIGMYASQMADLVPEQYRPISIEELEKVLIDRFTIQSQPISTPLARCSWIAILEGKTLRGEGSRITLAPSVDSALQVRSLIGSSSTAIRLTQSLNQSEPQENAPEKPEDAPESDADDQERAVADLSVDVNGQCWITGTGGEMLEMEWFQTGTERPEGVLFNLTPPEATVVQIWIAVPAGKRLKSPEAMILDSIAPPSWVAERGPPGFRWVSVESAGQSSLPLLVCSVDEEAHADSRTIVREARMRGQWESGFLRWQCQLSIDCNGSHLPDLELMDGQLDSAEWSGQPLGYRLQPEPSSTRSRIVWDDLSIADGSPEVSNRGTTTLVLSGHTPASATAGSSMTVQPLPSWHWDRSRFLIVPDVWQWQLTVPPNATLIDWKLPAAWTTGERSPGVWLAEGPPPTQTSSAETTTARSSMMLSHPSPFLGADRWLRLEMEKDSIFAKQRVRVRLPAGTLAPIQLDVQPGFTLQSVTMSASGRTVTPLPPPIRGGRLTVWPSAEEITEGVVEINLRASANLASFQKGSGGLPTVWLTRVRDCPGGMTAAIIPPAAMSWSSSTAVDPHRIEFGDLSDNQRAYLAPLPGDAILFGNGIDATPEVKLETPTTALAVSLRTTLVLHEDRVRQTIMLRPETSLTNVRVLRVALASDPNHPTPEVTWSLQTAPDRTPVVMTDVTTDRSDSNLVRWVLTVPRDFTAASQWIGHCDWGTELSEKETQPQTQTSSAPSTWHVHLPMLIDATIQSGEVWIDRQLKLLDPGTTLQGIPTIPNPTSISNLSVLRQGASPNSAASVSGESFDKNTPTNVSRWRYVNADRPWLKVATRDFGPPKHLVTREQLTMTISQSGNDRVTGDFWTHANSQLELRFPANFRLASVRCNGIQVLPVAIEGGALIELNEEVRRTITAQNEDPLRGLIHVQANWQTKSTGSSLIRRVTQPPIHLVGLTLGRHCQFVAAEDAWLCPLTVSESGAWALPRVWIDSSGWIAAFVVLAMSWVLADRRLSTLLGLFALSMVTAWMWPFASAPIAGFVMVPMVVGALARTTQRYVSGPEPSVGARSERIDRNSASGPPMPRRREDPIDDRIPVTPTGDRDLTSMAQPNQTDDSEFSANFLTIVGWIVVLSFVFNRSISAQSTNVPGSNRNDGAAVSPESDSTGATPTLDLLVPLRSDGTPLGDKVYIPETFYEQQWSAPISDPPVPVHTVSANYRLRIDATGLNQATNDWRTTASSQLTSMPNDIARQWTSEFSVVLNVETDQPCERIELPFVDDAVASVSLLTSEGRLREILVTKPTGARLVIDVQRGQRFEMTLQLNHQLEDGVSGLNFNASIPPLPLARMSISSNVPLGKVFCAAPAMADPRSPSTILVAATTSLQLKWPSLASAPAAPDPTVATVADPSATPAKPMWRRRIWNHLSPQSWITQWELKPPVELLDESPVQPTVALNLETPEGMEGPFLVGSDWRLQTDEKSMKGTSTTLRVTRVTENAGPIRVIWSRAIGDVTPTTVLSVPSTNVDIESTWIAWTTTPGINATFDASVVSKPLPTEQFYAQWAGYLGKIDRAEIVSGAFPGFSIQRTPYPIETIVTANRIHLGPTVQRIEWDVEFPPIALDDPAGVPTTESVARRYRIELPPNAVLLDWQMSLAGDPMVWRSDSMLTPTLASQGETVTTDTAPAVWSLHHNRNRFELLIDPPATGLTVSLVAEVTLEEPREVFDLPLVQVFPVAKTGLELDDAPENSVSEFPPNVQRSTLLVTHSVGTSLKWTRPPLGNLVVSGDDTASMLGDGRIPEGVWEQATPASADFGSPKVRITPRLPNYDADVRVTLRLEEGRWSSVADVQITSPSIPDFVDLEIPTRWCDSLSIEPVQAMSRQPTLDPARQVIRVSLLPRNGETSAPQSFRLVSRLLASDAGRIGVPTLRLLDVRRSRLDVVVPNRLTNELVRWQTTGVTVEPNVRWSIEEQSAEETSDRQDVTVYATNGPVWSIDLETVPQTNVAPAIVQADHQWMRRTDQEGGWLVTRWEVLPGDASAITFSVPPRWTLLGVWAAGNPADVTELDSSDDDPGAKQSEESWRRYSLVLPIHRLAQGIELLTSTETTPQSIPLPRCGEATPAVTTVAVWEERSNRIGVSNDEAARQRLQRLASSVVRCIATSTDYLADRRDEEVSAWLRPWVRRLARLSMISGRQLTLAQPTATIDQTLETKLPSAEQLLGDEPIPWESIDAYIALQTRRYFIDIDLEAPVDLFQSDAGWMRWFAVSAPETYELLDARTWNSAEWLLPSKKPTFQNIDLTTRGHVLRGLVAFMLASLIIVLTWPRSQITEGYLISLKSPATWLFLLGLAGYWLVPASIAMFLMLTAMVLGGFDPVMQWLHHRSMRRSSHPQRSHG